MLSQLSELREKLVLESLFEESKGEEIQNLFEYIFSCMVNSHKNYLDNIAQLIEVCEENEAKIFPYLFSLFYGSYMNFIENIGVVPFDDSIFARDYKDNVSVIERIEACLNNAFGKGHELQLSEALYDVSSLSKEELEFHLYLVRRIIVDSAENLRWSLEDVSANYFLMLISRQVAISSGHIELYYLTFGVFFDRLHTSEFHQKLRDLAEEVLISSFSDDIPEYGFYLSFRAFSNQSNTITGFVYGILLLFSILNGRRKSINNKLFVEIVWESIRFFRNAEYLRIVKSIYEMSKDKGVFSPYESRQIAHGYLSSLMLSGDNDLISRLEDFLSQWREEIIEGGVHDCLPWLMMIYNIKSNYAKRGYASSSLPYYENLFEMIVPQAVIGRHKNYIFGSAAEIKGYFIESLDKLNETRHKTDFSNDVKNAIFLSHKLISIAFAEQDYEAFLLAMIVSADFSFVFREKASVGRIAVSYEPEVNEIRQYYSNVIEFAKKTKIGEDNILVCLGVSGSKVYELFYGDEFKVFKLDSWKASMTNFWAKNNKESLRLVTSVKKGNVRMVFPEEHMAEGEVIKNNLSFTKILGNINAPVLLVKDMEIAGFPHNLLIGNEGGFIMDYYPVVNILSVEWMNNYLPNFGPIPKAYKKKMWIPIEDGDWPLLQIHSKLEESLVRQEVEVYDSSTLDEPLNAEMNIVVAHGGSDIRSFYALYTGDEHAISNIGRVIGHGKLLILFVCHAGSSEKGAFDNKMQSFVRLFLESGYEAVIAPFWALSIDVPPIWLPAFLDSFNAGDTVMNSFYHASQVVKENYPTPAAWACLHLYGNPYLKIDV